MKNTDIKLYNVIFPVWILWLFPLAFIVVIPMNFLIDLCVLYITARVMKIDNRKQLIKSSVFKIWGLGFLSDLIATALMFIALLINGESLGAFGRFFDTYISDISMNPFENIWAFLFTLLCVIIGGVCIYFLNYLLSFRKTQLEKSQKKKLCLMLAVFTAPYLFFLPTTLLLNY